MLLLSLAFAGPVELPELTEAEVKTLEARGIVVRDESSTAIVAFIDVAAPPEDVLAAVLDLPARAGDVDSLDQVTLYVEEPEKIGAKYEVSMLGLGAEFHVLYSIDRSQHYAEYTLDVAYENDIGASDGAYQVYANGTGSRMMYTADVSAGSTPTWIKKALITGSLGEQLEGMRGRAED